MYSGWGLTGGAIGWALAWVIQGVFFFPPLIVRFLKQSLWKDVCSSIPSRGCCWVGSSVAGLGYLNLVWFLADYYISFLELEFVYHLVEQQLSS